MATNGHRDREHPRRWRIERAITGSKAPARRDAAPNDDSITAFNEALAEQYRALGGMRSSMANIFPRPATNMPTAAIGTSPARINRDAGRAQAGRRRRELHWDRARLTWPPPRPGAQAMTDEERQRFARRLRECNAEIEQLGGAATDCKPQRGKHTPTRLKFQPRPGAQAMTGEQRYHQSRRPETIARTIKGFCQAYGVGKTTAYELIGAGQLRAVKAGKRTLIDEESARVWYASLATEKPSAQSHKMSHKRSADFGDQQRPVADK